MKLGILTLPRNDNRPIEEHAFFTDLERQGRQLDIEVTLFNPDQLGAECFNDHRSANAQQAMRIFEASKIDVIWDRCRWQRSARFQRFYRWRNQFLQSNQQSLFMNEPFTNKWRLHQKLTQPILQSIVPLSFQVPETSKNGSSPSKVSAPSFTQ